MAGLRNSNLSIKNKGIPYSQFLWIRRNSLEWHNLKYNAWTTFLIKYRHIDNSVIYWLSAQIFSHMISIDEFTKLQYGHFKCSDK